MTHDTENNPPPAGLDDPSRSGARQPERFDPAKADKLDDVSRYEYLPAQTVLELLDLPGDSLLVDFGAGTGGYAIPIALARPDVTVIALDEQPEMLDRLRAKPEAQGLNNLLPALPGEIGKFKGLADRVLALNVLHELGDDALGDLGALIGGGGFALCIDWNAEVDRPVGPPKDHVYTPGEAVARLERFDFAVEQLEPLPYHFVLRLRRR